MIKYLPVSLDSHTIFKLYYYYLFHTHNDIAFYVHTGKYSYIVNGNRQYLQHIIVYKESTNLYHVSNIFIIKNVNCFFTSSTTN